MKRGKEKKRKLLNRETLDGYLFIAPNVIGFLIFLWIPLFASFLLSFAKWNMLSGFGSIKWVSITNYIKLFSDKIFIKALLNNLYYTGVSVPISTVLAFIMALIIHNKVFLKIPIRVMVFMPYITSTSAVAVIFSLLYHPDFGPINNFLMSIGIENPPRWLFSKDWAMPAIIIMSIWKNTGFKVVIFLAGLQAVPNNFYEAADIEGSSTLQKIWYITIPAISSTTFFIVITGIIISFKVFDQVSIMTQGGPSHSTTVIVYQIFLTAFEDYKIGYSASMAWVMFAVLFTITLTQWIIQKNYFEDR